MSYDTGLSMEERVTSLFQPDTLLPEQYLDTFRRKLYLEPEKKLMLAILEDAIACFQKYAFARDSKGKALFTEAVSIGLSTQPTVQLLVASLRFRVFGASYLTTRNMNPETRNSVPQRGESAVAVEVFMNNVG